MMEHLYKTGVVNIRLRRLINEQTHYHIDYFVDKISDQTVRVNESDGKQHADNETATIIQQEQNKFSLSMSEVDDHRRQLTFCSLDLLDSLTHKTLMSKEQLKLLQMVERIFSIHVKLEISGHPEFQYAEEHHEIYDIHGDIKRILNNMKENSDQDLQEQLKEIISKRTKHFEHIYHRLAGTYDQWIEDLEKHRVDNKLLTLFSNRQIMIMIILLTVQAANNSTQKALFEKICFSKERSNYKENQSKLAIKCLMHYLRSLRLKDCDLSEQNVTVLYDLQKIDVGSKTDISLKRLSDFLRKLYNDGAELFPKSLLSIESQQYIITLGSLGQHSDVEKRSNDFNRDAYCILLNIFHDRLPADYQILWCSSASEDDIRLFFSRVRIFHSMIFAVMDTDKMHHRLRTVLWEEQDSLANRDEPHGSIYYFTQEMTTSRKGLLPLFVKPTPPNPVETYSKLIKMMENENITLPQIDIVYGTAGIGKTHKIRSEYRENNLSCISINDKLNLTSLISTLLSLESNMSTDAPLLYLNISIHAPLEHLNRALFSLFVCGSLNDIASGLTFSLSLSRPWQYVIEVPYTNICQSTTMQHFEKILPILSIMIISPNHLREVTDENYQLFIGEEEELVARFLKAYENGTIDRLAEQNSDDDQETDDPESNGQETDEQPVEFDPLTDHDEARQHIYTCLETNVPDLPRNKIFQLSFTKFLYRRVRFFTGFFYRYNTSIFRLGSIAMMQMIQEAIQLTQVNFSSDDYHRTYLVYDPGFALHLLHNDWNTVPVSLRILFRNCDPIQDILNDGKKPHIECLAWLIDIKYDVFEAIMHSMKFILTENFAYKLFHIHERKLTKLPLIIEGETGVGKTFLLKFYSSLLNTHISHGQLHENTTPRVLERTSIWLLKQVIENILALDSVLLAVFLQKVEPKLNNFDESQNDDDQEEVPPLIVFEEDKQEPRDECSVLSEIKRSLLSYLYDHKMLKIIWKTMLTVADKRDKSLSKKLIVAFHEFLTSQLIDLPLIEASWQLQKLLEGTRLPTIEKSVEIFVEFLVHTRVKPVFYRLLLHPDITEEKIVEFISPIRQLAIRVPKIELVVFFDEVNTSSCLGLFKEIFMDGTLHGEILPKNIFFTAAINPSRTVQTISDSRHNKTIQVHRCDYLVHHLPESLENLKISYGVLDRSTLEDYIKQKIATFTVGSIQNSKAQLPLEQYAQNVLMRSILNAQNFCERNLGHNSVSQREIQRCFNLIDFFWKLKYDENDQPDAMRCIALSLALIYYFRLPTELDNSKRNDDKTPSREKLGQVLDRTLPDFISTLQGELEKFVNTENFLIPPGVAVNQAIREHIFAIVVCVVTRIPLCIIGDPGQSKTLSFQIVLQNLQGSQLSPKPFCRRLPALDPFFCLGSEYTRSEDVAYVFDRANKREEIYRKIRTDTQCVVFLDEASLPDEKKMVLKVLHHYLDECQVSFVAVANKSFDAANANRMICVYRSLPSSRDQQVLAYGCLGLPITTNNRSQTKSHLDNIIVGLCEGYRRLLVRDVVPKIFHDRDFIYMLRELRFELPAITSTDDQQTSLNGIQPVALLHALEDNFNGINQNQFRSLVELFFQEVNKECPNFRLSTGRHNRNIYRDVPNVLQESMKLDSRRRRLYGRYKLIIDESEDDSAIRLLLQTGILDSDRNRTTIFRMSDFADDADNELRSVEILSSIKLCMEIGKTILMVNTSRIHGSLYDVFNQNFSIMATGDTRKIFSKVSIGAKTVDVIVHEDFQCIVHIKRNELATISAPFLSRFQKYSLSISDFYRIRLQKLPKAEQEVLKNVEKETQSFIEHFGRQYFYGLNDNTLYSCLLSLIETKRNGDYSLFNISHHYTQLTIRSKSFISPNLSNIQQSLFRIVISRLIQIASPESIILKLRTFENTFAQGLSNVYFQEQEHFNIENFLQRLTSKSFTTTTNNESSVGSQNEREIRRTTKVMIFTRTSSYILSMNQRSKYNLIHHNYHENKNQTLNTIGKVVKILNLVSFIDK
ncbi:unnamed protein product [Rotaria magnacalcarata]|uniref:Uncharacterized protein n=4 Tax=Rotaria magnacalcarata TaxID=392030 RepID=A0A815Z5L9_9BILA|nr:unnamed protein product [Rotaria magnacalcarata]CAF3858315.1 unnamed protein product [Rotaria magnacalcarata]